MSSYALELQRAQMIDAHLAEQKRQRDEFDQRIADINARIAEAKKAEMDEVQDPEVLVRGSLGARRKIYHRAADPCGRTLRNGGGSQAFTRMRESEAKQMDSGILKRCHACWNY